jgi:excinuclease ABC subunit A
VALQWFRELPGKLTDTQNQIARAILKEIVERLGFSTTSGSITSTSTALQVR